MDDKCGGTAKESGGGGPGVRGERDTETGGRGGRFW